MSDYLPHAFPGDIYTFTAGGTITGGNVVKIDTTTDMQVLAGTTDNVNNIGVAARDAVITQKVPVYCRGTIHRLVAQGAITRGDTVSSGTVAGSVHTLAAAGTAWRADLGIALESIADTATGRVMFF